MVLALFGAVGILGAVGYGYSTLIKGPARGVSEITSRTASETDIFAAANILISSARENQAAEGDCDTDSYIEPLPWRAPAGAPAPAGGGLIPTGTPAVTTDSWGTVLGYCAWDHGAVSVSDNNAGCGGSAALRREGGEVKVEEVIAVISAGPDRIFQTTCSNYVNPATPLITKAAGSDDLFVKFTYAEAFDAAGMGGGGLGDVEDAACVPEAIGLMRYEMEVVQVCLDDGAGGAVWKEVGSEADANPGYTPTNNATVNTLYTSNAISFTGYFGTRLATVDNGGTILLNGTPVGASAQVAVGDTVAIRGTSAATNQVTKIFNLNISSIVRPWALTTVNKTAPIPSISPTAGANRTMTVDGISGMTSGSSAVITISQAAAPTTQDRVVVGVPSIAPTTNFTVTGNTCATLPEPNKLTLGGSCTITVTARASATGLVSATLTVPTTGELNGAVNNLTTPLYADSLFPVTLTNSTNLNISARAEFTTVPTYIAGTRWSANRPKRVIVPSGVIIGSNAPATPAMQSGTGWGGTLYVTVDAGGSIQGAGGLAGTAGAGGVGGTAFFAQQLGIQFLNNGTVYGGGGGGGQGGPSSATVTQGPTYNGSSHWWSVMDWYSIPDQVNIYWAGTNPYYNSGNMGTTAVSGSDGWTYYRSGGVQGSGNIDDAGGTTYGQYYLYALYRQQTQATPGGNGGKGQGFDGANTAGLAGSAGSGPGGNGGTWGLPGVVGTAGSHGAGNAPGLAGYSIQNIGNVTLTGSGIRLGQ